MLFAARFRQGLEDGTIDLTFRNWKRPQVKVGGRYQTIGGELEVDEIELVPVPAITEEDAARAGAPSVEDLKRTIKAEDGDTVYRIAFHRTGTVRPPAPPPFLDDATMAHRLARLDERSPVGPWTSATLQLIAARPAVRAGDLAAQLGRERLSFKADVRKLKRLGLTESLEVGYRLSPRGEQYLGKLRPGR